MDGMKKKSVCVIGAGISGIVSAKELRAVGIDADVYEQMPVIGGVFAHYGWKEGKLTSSTVFTWFSDFPIKDRQKHMNWPEWLQYLDDYVDHFKIRDRFIFNTRVLNVTRCESGGYDITLHKKNWSNGWWTHPQNNEVMEETTQKHYDVVIMGTGFHHNPFMPDWMGADSFKEAGGMLLHSTEFMDAKDYAGKKVIVAGGGESGSDIAWLVSKVAKETIVSLRSPPGTMFAHTINGNTADIRDNRLIYSLPRVCWPFLVKGQKYFYETLAHEDEGKKECFRWAAKQNYDARNCIFTINACKSFGIPKAVCYNNAKVTKMIKKFEGRTVTMVDGEMIEDVDAVIAATGFAIDITALPAGEFKKRYTTHPRYLWKNMMSPGINDFFVLGFCRPHQINLITCCEMQARAAALIITGQRKIPSQEQQQQEIDDWVHHMQQYFPRGYKGLVDFIPFIDGLAQFIGCAPDLRNLFFTDFKMWVSMMYAPIQPCQYRLTGPGAKPELARETILATPFYKWAGERIIRDAVVTLLLFGAALLSLLGLDSDGMEIKGMARQFFQFIAGLWILATGLSAYSGHYIIMLILAIPALISMRLVSSATRQSFEMHPKTYSSSSMRLGFVAKNMAPRLFVSGGMKYD